MARVPHIIVEPDAPVLAQALVSNLSQAPIDVTALLRNDFADCLPLPARDPTTAAVANLPPAFSRAAAESPNRLGKMRPVDLTISGCAITVALGRERLGVLPYVPFELISPVDRDVLTWLCSVTIVAATLLVSARAVVWPPGQAVELRWFTNPARRYLRRCAEEPDVRPELDLESGIGTYSPISTVISTFIDAAEAML